MGLWDGSDGAQWAEEAKTDNIPWRGHHDAVTGTIINTNCVLCLENNRRFKEGWEQPLKVAFGWSTKIEKPDIFRPGGEGEQVIEGRDRLSWPLTMYSSPEVSWGAGSVF